MVRSQPVGAAQAGCAHLNSRLVRYRGSIQKEERAPLKRPGPLSAHHKERVMDEEQMRKSGIVRRAAVLQPVINAYKLLGILPPIVLPPAPPEPPEE